MPSAKSTVQKQHERIATLQAENRQLKEQLEKETRALLVAEAKYEMLESENKRLSHNISLSQKVILEDMAEGKRYRKEIRKERRLRKAATEGNLHTVNTFLSAKK